jgi:hypothetical protein
MSLDKGNPLHSTIGRKAEKYFLYKDNTCLLEKKSGMCGFCPHFLRYNLVG